MKRLQTGRDTKRSQERRDKNRNKMSCRNLNAGYLLAPVNKLVSLTWILWVLRSFRSFTLH